MRRTLVLLASLAAPLVLLASLLAVPASSQTGATVMLLHGIPGTPVDVYVGGQPVIPNFQPAAMQDLSSFAGQTLTDVAVVPAGGSLEQAVLKVPSLDVPSSGNWTVVAHLTADGKPTLTPFRNDTGSVPAGQGRVTIRHTAAAPAVDIVVGDQRPFTGLSNPNEVTAVLPAGPLPAQVAAAGGGVLASVGDLLGSAPSVAEGANTILYAVGSLEGRTFDIYAQSISGLSSAPSAVQTGNSPIDAGGSSRGAWVVGLAAAAVAGAAVVSGRRLRLARA